MPTYADIMSSLLNPPDPNDLTRDQMGQGQTLTGLAQIPGQGAPMPPSPNVAGPLTALTRITPTLKPHIRLKTGLPMLGKPRIKLKIPQLLGS